MHVRQVLRLMLQLLYHEIDFFHILQNKKDFFFMDAMKVTAELIRILKEQ